MEPRFSRSAFTVSLKEETGAREGEEAGAAVCGFLVPVEVHPMIPRDTVTSPIILKTCFIGHDVSGMTPLQVQSSAEFTQEGDEFSLQEDGNSLLYHHSEKDGITASQDGNNQSGMPEMRAKGIGRREFLRQHRGMSYLFRGYLLPGESARNRPENPRFARRLFPRRGLASSSTCTEERVPPVRRPGT